MNGIARLTFRGGERLMPVRSGYDRELVFEEAEFFARRHGRATLELDRLALQIGVAASGDAATCAKCAQPLASLFFSVGDRHLCRRCARKSTR